MGRFIFPLFLVALVAGALFWFFKDEVHYLQGYQGKIVRAYRDEVSDGTTGGVQSDTMLELETAAGRVSVLVPHSVYVDARPGMTITKRRFSNRVIMQ